MARLISFVLVLSFVHVNANQDVSLDNEHFQHRECCLTSDPPACCAALPLPSATQDWNETSRSALISCCGFRMKRSAYSAFARSDGAPVYRATTDCCRSTSASFERPSCCSSSASTIRAMCCVSVYQPNDALDRQQLAPEPEEPPPPPPSSCCDAAVKLSCCMAAAAAAVRPQCCSSSRPDTSLSAQRSDVSRSDAECCSVHMNFRDTCCSRFASVHLVARCCLPPEGVVQLPQYECCSTPSSLRESCCEAGFAAGASAVHCCTAPTTPIPTPAPAPRSDCCSASALRPVCCVSSFTAQARSSCCQTVQYPVHEPCCSSSSMVDLSRCCAVTVVFSPCCAARQSPERLISATPTTTTTARPAYVQVSCCSSSSPAYRDQCCGTASPQLVLQLPCCTTSRAYVMAQQARPNCCSSSGASTADVVRAPAPVQRTAVLSCCLRTGSMRESCCSSQAQTDTPIRCCSGYVVERVDFPQHEQLAPSQPTCCARSSESDARSCCMSYAVSVRPQCCSSYLVSFHPAPLQDAGPNCCTGTVLVRAQCCAANAFQSSTASCCTSSASQWVAAPIQQPLPSCCHTPASIRVPCCISSSYAAPCCQSMRRRYR